MHGVPEIRDTIQPRWLGDPETRSLARTSARSGAFVAAAQIVIAIMQFGSTAVLARLLVPEDFGLFAMVMSLSFVLAVFRDFSVGQAIVQREGVTPREVHGVFWWTVIGGLVTAGLFAAAAPLMAVFYDEPRVVLIAVVLGVVTGVTSLSAVPNALLMRKMRFGSIAIRRVLSMAIGAGAAIAAAAMGAGYWALVVQVAAHGVADLAMNWSVSKYLPAVVNAWRESWPLVTFGAKNMGAQLFNQGSRKADNIIIGRVAGSEALGEYAVAYRILMLPIQQFSGPATNVAIPTLSRLQSEPERYRRFYRHALLLVTTMAMPIVVVLAVAAHPLIRLLFGEGWERAALLFQVLAPLAFIGSFNNAHGWAYVSCGQVGRQMRWAIYLGATNLVAFLIGANWGVVGVAAAASINMCAMRVVGLWYCYRFTIPTYPDFLRAVYRPGAASLGAGVAGWYALGWCLSRFESLAAGLVVFMAIYGVCYIVLWCVIPGSRAAMGDIKHTVRLLRPGGRSAGAELREGVS